MSNYYYAGLTAYLKDTLETDSHLSFLSEAIFQLSPFVSMDVPALAVQDTVRNSTPFQHVAQNHALFTNNALAFPQNTPVAYQSVHTERVAKNGHNFIRLHIPVISEDSDEITDMACGALPELFNDLFGSGLVCMKIKMGCEWEDFEMIQPDTMKSVVPAV